LNTEELWFWSFGLWAGADSSLNETSVLMMKLEFTISLQPFHWESFHSLVHIATKVIQRWGITWTPIERVGREADSHQPVLTWSKTRSTRWQRHQRILRAHRAWLQRAKRIKIYASSGFYMCVWTHSFGQSSARFWLGKVFDNITRKDEQAAD